MYAGSPYADAAAGPTTAANGTLYSAAMSSLQHGGGATPTGSRPSIHFTSRAGWINDPYGLTWHDGRYHLFFQHVPSQVVWGLDTSWGHAVSDDLVHWTEQPVALSPGDGDDGIWSGCVVTAPDGESRIFYTSVHSETLRLGAVRVARPADPQWNAWNKGETVVTAPGDVGLVEFRDPYVVHDGTTWRMVVGGGTSDGTGLALSWTSSDLDTWTYAGVLASRAGSEADADPVWTGSAWECPQLFRLDDGWVLLVSVWAEGMTRHEAYAIGDLVEGRFIARSWRRLTYGPAHYAGSVFTDREGRRCLLHWLRGVADRSGEWAGAHSVPHALSLDGDRIVAAPHPQVASGAEPLLPGTRQLADHATLTVDGRGLTVDLGSQSFSMPSGGAPMQVLVDGPIVEVFGHDGVAGFGIQP